MGLTGVQKIPLREQALEVISMADGGLSLIRFLRGRYKGPTSLHTDVSFSCRPPYFLFYPCASLLNTTPVL